MTKLSGKTCKLISVMGLVVLYFFVELIIGFFIQSLALVADAFHMLSDFIALLVGIVAARLMKMPSSPRNTYGWQRADVVGTLINTVILSTLCFTIVVRAIERFIEVHHVHQPIVMVGVGSGGLLINLISLCILRHHGHSHGSHVHKLDQVIELNEDTTLISPPEPAQDGDQINESTHIRMSSSSDLNMVSLNHIDKKEEPDVVVIKDVALESDGACVKTEASCHKKPVKTKGDMNMKAVFLHVMADALGSVIVVVSALILYFSPKDSKWTVYVDPGMSLVLVVIIMISTSKLLYQSALILLQSVPNKVKYSQIKVDMEKIVGKDKVHDLHIWRLQTNCIIGTVHIRCNDLVDYISSSKEVKTIFHQSDIHCTTIQPEFDAQETSNSGSMDLNRCVIECGSDKKCNQKICCPTENANHNHTHHHAEMQPPIQNVNHSA